MRLLRLRGVRISIPEALRGGTIEVPTLEGTKKINVAPGTRHGAVQRLRGEGPPKPKGGGRWEPWAIQVIEVRDGKISGHHNFLDDHGGVRLGLFEELGLPPYLEG